MLNAIKTYHQFGNRFCGVEHATKGNNEILYATVLKKSRKALDTYDFIEANSVEELALRLNKKQHVFLIINNDNVLTKCVEVKNQVKKEALVYNAFPNLDLNDFYFEILTQDDAHFVSICRRGYLDALILEYKKHNISIINIALGNNVLSNITDFFNRSSIMLSNAEAALQNKQIKSFEKVEVLETTNYNVNGIITNNFGLLSLSAALDTVINQYSTEGNLDFHIQTLRQNFFQSRFYSQFIKVGLVIILSVLLINFFVFSHYFNRVNDLQQTAQINENTKQDLLLLNEEVDKSQKMVEDMLKTNASKSSYYTNAIIQSLPQSILLSELNYQPLLKSIKKDKAVNTEANTITISGLSNKSEAFSKWLNTLERVYWVNHVNVSNYEDTSSSQSKFSIKLDITHER